jgi:hypothetical protein
MSSRSSTTTALAVMSGPIRRPMPDCATTAILFDVHLVKWCFPAAIRRHRRGEVWRRAGGRGPSVLE